MFSEPIPYGDHLNRFYRRELEARQQMEVLIKIARETGGNIAEEREKRRSQHTAADGLSLRGLPAVGRGVSGAIAHTDPAGEVVRRDERRRR